MEAGDLVTRVSVTFAGADPEVASMEEIISTRILRLDRFTSLINLVLRLQYILHKQHLHKYLCGAILL